MRMTDNPLRERQVNFEKVVLESKIRAEFSEEIERLNRKVRLLEHWRSKFFIFTSFSTRVSLVFTTVDKRCAMLYDKEVVSNE